MTRGIRHTILSYSSAASNLYKVQVIHADFMRVDMTAMTSFTVPLRIQGEAEGVKSSDGVLDVILHSLEIRCLPGELPEAIDVDVTALGIGTHISVGDLKLAAGITAVTDGEAIIATCISPRVEEPAAAAAVTAVSKQGKTVAWDNSRVDVCWAWLARAQVLWDATQPRHTLSRPSGRGGLGRDTQP